MKSTHFLCFVSILISFLCLAAHAEQEEKVIAGKLFVRDLVCFRVTTELTVSITYELTHPNKTEDTVKVQFLNSTELGGACSLTEVNSTFTFSVNNKPWELRLQWNMVKKDYWVTEASLTYFLDDKTFPNAKYPNVWDVQEGTDLELFRTNTDASYMCDSELKQVLVEGEASFSTKNLQVEAFEFDDETADKFKTAVTCKEDDKTSSLVPIIVGCVLVGLIVITLVGYFIGKARQSRANGYDKL